MSQAKGRRAETTNQLDQRGRPGEVNFYKTKETMGESEGGDDLWSTIIKRERKLTKGKRKKEREKKTKWREGTLGLNSER